MPRKETKIALVPDRVRPDTCWVPMWRKNIDGTNPYPPNHPDRIKAAGQMYDKCGACNIHDCGEREI